MINIIIERRYTRARGGGVRLRALTRACTNTPKAQNLCNALDFFSCDGKPRRVNMYQTY